MDQRTWGGAEPKQGEVNVSLAHEQAAATLRLTHALVYANVQGRTIRDKRVVLLDTHHRCFTMRHLIAGMSRVTHGSNLHIPQVEQEEALMLRTQPAPQQYEAELQED